jgi:NTP pyrophosphatase (non-canonical NTP hydrolase)
MTIFEEFARSVSYRAKVMPTFIENILYGAVGASGETGELLDAVKKSWIYNKTLDEVNLLEEIGDVMWYLQHIANHLDITLEYAMIENMAKLEKRYPMGYSDSDAIARADKE